MSYQDYIIRMDELDKPNKKEPEKKVSRLRSFLAGTLRKPLVIDFSKDAKSTFTSFPGYQRFLGKKK